MNWEFEINLYTLLILCVEEISSESLLLAQETLLIALW